MQHTQSRVWSGMTGWRKKPEHQAGPDVWSEGAGVDEAEWRLVGQAAETAPVAARGCVSTAFRRQGLRV